jgi:hypothetical protein
MPKLLTAIACSMAVAAIPQHALADAEDDEEVTCSYVASKNTFYCEIGTFNELNANCQTTGDADSCCVVTAGESGTCADPDSTSGTISVSAILRRVLNGHAVTFSPPSEKAKRYKE